MSRVCIVVLLAAGSLLLTPARAGSAPRGPVERGSRVALMPVQDRAGDQRTATDLEQIIRFEISKTAQVLDPAAIRPMLRRLRIRNVDNLAPDRMRAVAAGARSGLARLGHAARLGPTRHPLADGLDAGVPKF